MNNFDNLDDIELRDDEELLVDTSAADAEDIKKLKQTDGEIKDLV